jgi:hypothetical protein
MCECSIILVLTHVCIAHVEPVVDRDIFVIAAWPLCTLQVICSCLSTPDAFFPFDLMFLVIALTGRALVTSCKQGNKQ